MNADQILTEIREANLSYLMLAQSLIRADCQAQLDVLVDTFSARSEG